MTRRSAFTRLLDGLVPPEHLSSPESTRTARLAVGTYLIVAVATGYYAFLSLQIDFPGGMYGQLLLFGISVLCLILYQRGVWPSALAALFFSGAIVSIAVPSYFSGGVHSPTVPWLATSPIAALLVVGKRAGLLTLAGALVALGVFVWLDQTGATPPTQVPEIYRGALLVSAHVGLIGIVFALAWLFQRSLEAAFEGLRQAQRQLVQQEKMASLGALTAGIAHEIKNPLNFVNNFARASVELVGDLREELAAAGDGPDPEGGPVSDLMDDLAMMTTKIAEHGDRADRIVTSMLQHSRGGGGTFDEVAVNAFVDDYVDLAFHGMRAHDSDFNVDVVRDYDDRVGSIQAVPQELGRVLINLLNNAFYAVHEQRGRLGGAYASRVCVRTRQLDGELEIRVEDNGPGMPESARERVFEPFFTTKPPGEGTGLGLSLSYDVVTQMHGGTLVVESDEGTGATFVVTLPA